MNTILLVFRAPRRAAGPLAMAGLGLLLTACATPASRIRENPEQFASYPEDARSAIQDGKVELGFTPDMVRMAKGDPSRVYTRVADDGEREIWQYNRVEFDIRTHHLNVTGRARGAYGGFVQTEDTRTLVEQRVEFQAGRVVSLETLRED